MHALAAAPLAPFTLAILLLAACGGTTDEPVLPGATAAVPPAPATAASGAALPLGEWLRRLAERDGLRVTVADGIAQQPVAGALPPRDGAAELLAALGAFDLTLAYARQAGRAPTLAALNVQAPGALPAAGTAPAARAEAGPSGALQSLQRELADGDPAVRRDALARSFELEAALPVPVLSSALQADASAEVRLYALMALARHPQLERAQWRSWLQAARHDPDAGVRAEAADLHEQLDADEQAE